MTDISVVLDNGDENAPGAVSRIVGINVLWRQRAHRFTATGVATWGEEAPRTYVSEHATFDGAVRALAMLLQSDLQGARPIP